MHKLNPRTAALLSAFGWAVGYLLAGKALAVLLPVPSGGAARRGGGYGAQHPGDREKRLAPRGTAGH